MYCLKPNKSWHGRWDTLPYQARLLFKATRFSVYKVERRWKDDAGWLEGVPPTHSLGCWRCRSSRGGWSGCEGLHGLRRLLSSVASPVVEGGFEPAQKSLTPANPRPQKGPYLFTTQE